MKIQWQLGTPQKGELLVLADEGKTKPVELDQLQETGEQVTFLGLDAEGFSGEPLARAFEFVNTHLVDGRFELCADNFEGLHISIAAEDWLGFTGLRALLQYLSDLAAAVPELETDWTMIYQGKAWKFYKVKGGRLLENEGGIFRVNKTAPEGITPYCVLDEDPPEGATIGTCSFERK